jgi:RNA polymerase sigma-70 factor (ECF subfamily)
VVQRDLVQAAAHGDHDAFEALATTISSRLYAVAHLILGDTHLAEDALQEALVHAWLQLPALRDPDRFDAWMRRLLINACADVGRDRRRRSAEIQATAPESGEPDAIAALADRDLLDRALRHLKPDQRAAIVLHYYVGLPAREVADALDIPVGTAKSRIHYATEVMRAELDRAERVVVATLNGRVS